MDVGEVHELMAEIEENVATAIKEKVVDAEYRDTARLCLTAAVFGCKNIDELAFRTKLPRDRFVRPRARRMRQSGIWRNDGTVAFETDPENDPAGSNIEFLLHVLCAEGLVECTSRGDEPTPAGRAQLLYQPGENEPTTRFDRLLSWRCEGLPKPVTPEILVENLSVEGLRTEVDSDFREEVTAFRHLSAAARLATARRYLASLG
jgi:hypothetical protein